MPVDATPPARSRLRVAVGNGLDALFFLTATAATLLLAYAVAGDGVATRSGLVVYFLLAWAITAYLALPRIHRALSSIYVPGYFIGRSRTADGLLGDPINLAADGTEEQVHAAMRAAGWTLADPVSLGSSIRIVTASLSRRSYPEAPFSPLYLFGRPQDFGYQQEVEGNPAQRHHVRFWRCPEGWLLPGGRRVEWLAAGSYDTAVGISYFTLQVTHRIDADIDAERDHIVDTLLAAYPGISVDLLRNFSTGYHTRNGGGDRIRTDGDMPVLDLTGIDVPPGAPDATTTPKAIVAPAAEPASMIDAAGASVRRRPAAIVAGTILALLLAVSMLTSGLTLDVRASALGEATPQEVLEAVRTELFVIAPLLLAGALFTYRGHNWARYALLAFGSIVAFGYLLDGGRVERGLSVALVHVTAYVLMIYVLTASSAQEWCRVPLRVLPASRPRRRRTPHP